MKFSELMKRVAERGVKVVEVRAGENPEILGVCEDSRKVRAGDLFVARGGTKTDGSKFMADAISRGAVAVVVEKDERRKTKDEIEPQRTQSTQRTMDDVNASVFSSVVNSFAVVEDVNLACAILAHDVAGNPTSGMTMIGITGTKGKTTVAYLMRSVLKAAGFKVGMIGTVEIDYGPTTDGRQDACGTVPAEMTTPGSVELVALFSRMKANGVTHCVMEVSSHALDQQRVAGIDWKVAIFTNLTGDHLDYHGTMEAYAAAKARLFSGLKVDAVAVVNGDDEWVDEIVKGSRARVLKYRVSSGNAEDGPYPSGMGTGFVAEITRMQPDGMDFFVTGLPSEWMNRREMAMGQRPPNLDRGMSVRTPLVGRHNAYNLLSVMAGASALEIGIGPVLLGLHDNRGAPGRLQGITLRGIRGNVKLPFQVFVDYAHTHDALENVLTALRATMGGVGVSKDAARGLGGESRSAYAVENGGLRAQGRLICMFGCGGDRDRTKRPKMGAIAERLADVVIVTSDNPRTEEPGEIIGEICAGFSPGWRDSGKITVEPDRRAAIRMAIGMARPGDVVLLAGKGHENYQIMGTTKHHFDDVEEAQAALAGVTFQHQDTKPPRPPS